MTYGTALLFLLGGTVHAQDRNTRLFKVYLSLSDAYDSNVLQSNGQGTNKGDNILYIEPSLGLRLPFRFRADFDLNYTFSYVDYSTYTALSTYYNNLSASLNFYPVDNLYFGILDQYTVVPINPQLPVFAATNITQTNYLNPYVAYKFPIVRDRLAIDVRYDFIDTIFPGSLGINYYVNQPQADLDWSLDRYVDIKPGYLYISQTFASKTLGTINQSEPFIELDVTNRSKLSFQGRYGYTTFSYNTGRELPGNDFLAKLLYKSRERLSTDIYANGQKTFDIFGNIYLQDAAGLDVSYNILESLVFNLNAQYQLLKYAGQSYYTDAPGGNAGLTYTIRPWIQVFATYYYFYDKPRVSNVNGYQDSRIQAGIRAGLL